MSIKFFLRMKGVVDLLKKTISIIMAICLMMLSLCVGAFAAERKTALPTSAGIAALRNEFESDVAPEAEGFALDYCYYSPVGEGDETKYPLVIFLHGIGHADYVGAQLADSDMPYWASAELQSRFTSGGAYILLPRAPEDKLVYWSSSMIEPLRSVIDDFIAKHGENIDDMISLIFPEEIDHLIVKEKILKMLNNV
jgi:predicted peptidase